MERTHAKVYQNNGNPGAIRLIEAHSKRVLDVGCGAGSNAKILYAGGRLVDGITLSEMEAQLAATYCEKVWLHDLEDGLPSDVRTDYDCCLCSHVIEHLADPNKMLSSIRKSLLTSGGSLVVALPNFLFWKCRLKLALGQFKYEESGIWDHTHLRWYTFETGRRLLEDNGFRVQYAGTEGSIPQPYLRKVIPTIARKLDELAISGLPGVFGWQLLYRATPF
jgi:SAM-dependent methyltransferase